VPDPACGECDKVGFQWTFLFFTRGNLPVRPPFERLIDGCCLHWRELTFAGVVVAVSAVAITTGMFCGQVGWHIDDYALETMLEEGIEIEPLLAEATEGASDDELKESYFIVEDSLTGQAIKRTRPAKSSGFKRWARYKVLDSYEMAGRLVAGQKESKSYIIRVQPKGSLLPNIEQLQEIAESLKSREHFSTYVYFFLPGMELKQNPWSTVFQQSNRPTAVSFDRTNVPPLYRRFEEQVWK
jgi:hypothetical protein